MLKSFSRLFVIYHGYRLKLIFSQVLLFISALCMIGVATLTQRLINEGIATTISKLCCKLAFGWLFWQSSLGWPWPERPPTPSSSPKAQPISFVAGSTRKFKSFLSPILTATVQPIFWYA